MANQPKTGFEKLLAMGDPLKPIFEKLNTTADFENADFSDVNACSTDGDDALHCVVRWNDLAAARALIGAGIDVNKAGDLGYTPLHVACMGGNKEMVGLLIDCGADLFSLSEGDAPFACARLAKQDHICEMLEPLMEREQSKDPKIWVRARIAQLRREIADLEKKL
jgi:ankyrin repeat protein